MRVIITRPIREARRWVQILDQTGYDAVEFPLIEVAASADRQAVLDAAAALGRYDAVMFVSGNAVDHFFAVNQDIAHIFNEQSPFKARAFATGPGTVAALLRVRADMAWIDAPGADAQQFDSEALWAVVGPQVKEGFRVLVVRGAGGASAQVPTVDGDGRDWFARQVRAAGGAVDFVVAYQRNPVPFGDEERALVHLAAQDGSIWLFSSSEAIGNLIAACPGEDWSHARAVVTHARIGAAAKAAGFGLVRESRPTVPALLASIESLG